MVWALNPQKSLVNKNLQQTVCRRDKDVPMTRFEFFCFYSKFWEQLEVFGLRTSKEEMKGQGLKGQQCILDKAVKTRSQCLEQILILTVKTVETLSELV